MTGSPTDMRAEEGDETVDELATLIEIGVDLGQGFLLGRPSSGFIEPKPEIAAFIRERSSTLRSTRTLPTVPSA